MAGVLSRGFLPSSSTIMKKLAVVALAFNLVACKQEDEKVSTAKAKYAVNQLDIEDNPKLTLPNITPVDRNHAQPAPLLPASFSKEKAPYIETLAPRPNIYVSDIPDMNAADYAPEGLPDIASFASDKTTNHAAPAPLAQPQADKPYAQELRLAFNLPAFKDDTFQASALLSFASFMPRDTGGEYDPYTRSIGEILRGYEHLEFVPDTFPYVEHISAGIRSPWEVPDQYFDAPISSGYSNGVDTYIVLDTKTGAVLDGKGIDQVVGTASLMKQLTFAVIAHDLKSDKLKLDDTLTVPKYATTAMPLAYDGNLRAGHSYKVSDLLHRTVALSQADATLTLAHHFGDGEGNKGIGRFVKRMREFAKHFGMDRTQVEDPVGYGHGNLSTARDIARLNVILNTLYPDYVTQFASRNSGRHTLARLFQIEQGVFSGKTGTSSGFSGASEAVLYRNGNKEAVFIAMGARSHGQARSFIKGLIDDNKAHIGRSNKGSMIALSFQNRAPR